MATARAFSLALILMKISNDMLQVVIWYGDKSWITHMFCMKDFAGQHLQTRDDGNFWSWCPTNSALCWIRTEWLNTIYVTFRLLFSSVRFVVNTVALGQLFPRTTSVPSVNIHHFVIRSTCCKTEGQNCNREPSKSKCLSKIGEHGIGRGMD